MDLKIKVQFYLFYLRIAAGFLLSPGYMHPSFSILQDTNGKSMSHFLTLLFCCNLHFIIKKLKIFFSLQYYSRLYYQIFYQTFSYIEETM
jgi:hypothetical protein